MEYKFNAPGLIIAVGAIEIGLKPLNFQLFKARVSLIRFAYLPRADQQECELNSSSSSTRSSLAHNFTKKLG